MKSLSKINFVWFFFKNLEKRYPTIYMTSYIICSGLCMKTSECGNPCCMLSTYKLRNIYMYTGLVYVYIYRNANDVKCKWPKCALCQLSLEESFGFDDWLKNQIVLHSFIFFCCICFEKIFLCDLVSLSQNFLTINVVQKWV